MTASAARAASALDAEAWGARVAASAAGCGREVVLLVLNYRLPRVTAALWHRGAPLPTLCLAGLKLSSHPVGAL